MRVGELFYHELYHVTIIHKSTATKCWQKTKISQDIIEDTEVGMFTDTSRKLITMLLQSVCVMRFLG